VLFVRFHIHCVIIWCSSYNCPITYKELFPYCNLAIPHREIPLSTSRGSTGQFCVLDPREQSPVNREHLVLQHVSNSYEHFWTLYYGSTEYRSYITLKNVRQICGLGQIQIKTTTWANDNPNRCPVNTFRIATSKRPAKMMKPKFSVFSQCEPCLRPATPSCVVQGDGHGG
jgi:hypothetical protein